MKTFAKATCSSKLPALECDQWVAVDGRLSLNDQALFARESFMSLRILFPCYDGYDILHGASIATAKVIKSFVL